MKKKLTVVIIISAVFLAAYLVVFFFIYPETWRTFTYLLPAIVLAVMMIFLLGYIALLDSFARENAKYNGEMALNKSLLESLKANDKAVSDDLPVALIFYDEKFNVTYSNEAAKNLFQNRLDGRNLDFVSPELASLIKNKKTDEIFDVFGRKVKVVNRFQSRTSYFFDVTEQQSILDKYDASAPAVIIISFDNMKGSLDTLNMQKRTEILGLYYSAVQKWTDEYHIFSFGSYSLSASNEKQMFIAKKGELDAIIKDQFTVLSDIDQISKDNETSVSLSIGVGVGTYEYEKLGQYADTALSFASDRGGDQAVVYDGDTEQIFGGKTSLSERKNVTEAKFNANRLAALIEKSSAVIVMPHSSTDADAIGSALGVATIAEAYGTPAKVLLDPEKIDSTVAKILKNADSEYIKLRGMIIRPSEVESFFQGRTLLVVIDHHDIELSPNRTVYKLASKTAIIDHHRLTGKLQIENALDYIDHNASSAVEIVTEFMNLLPISIKIPPFIATVMLTGMLIDTQNFVSHTSDRTFEAAASLMENGADTAKAKSYLRESVKDVVDRAKLLQKAEVYADKFAIIIDDSETVKRDDLAKTAEILLDIDNVIAGFAIGKLDEKTVGVSGRSNGTFNIHSLLEMMGGGGHFNIGAAQIVNKTTLEVEQNLKEDINIVVKGDGSTMKVILVEDVRKQGKKGDTIDVTPGFGVFLISKKQAIEANAANIAALEEEKAQKERQAQDELEVAQKLKAILDKVTVKIAVKVGQSGKFFGSVSTKDISDALEAQEHITVDKRKIDFANSEKITALGNYDVTARLNKDVTANFKIQLVEE